MLARSLSARALGALFGGERAADALHLHLTNLWRARRTAETSKVQAPPTKDEFADARHLPRKKAVAVELSPKLDAGALRTALATAAKEDIDERTSKRHRLNEVETAVSALYAPPFLDKSAIPAFDELLGDLFDCSGVAPQFRDEQVHRYAEVLSEIDPTVIVAWQLASTAASSASASASALAATVEETRRLFVGSKFLGSEVAEGHVHINGLAGEGLVLGQLVLSHQWPPKLDEQHPLTNRLRRIRRILKAGIGAWQQWPSSDPDGAIGRARETDWINAAPDSAQRFAANPSVHWMTVRDGFGPTANGSPQVNLSGSIPWMLRQLVVAAAAHDLQRAWIWMFVLIWQTYRDAASTTALRAVMLLLVADIMVIRRQLMMDGSGLRRFVTQVFPNGNRAAAGYGAWEEVVWADSAGRLFERYGDMAEVKIAAAGLSGERNSMAAFAAAAVAQIDAIRRRGHGEAPPVDHARARQHWHLCATFSREVKARRDRLWKQAYELRCTMQSLREWHFEGLGEKTGLAVLPADLIRGLDVVGDETRNGIEMFAPMLRWLRDEARATHAHDRKLDALAPPKAKLHLSVHAGEDYAHPLSGLRRIDETVRFCDMGAGDRLGHALALGIPPDDWLRRHGEVMLPVGDHLDNLVWAWHQACQLEDPSARHQPFTVSIARKARLRLEARIRRLVVHLSWYPTRPEGSPDLGHADFANLHGAWEMRRNCPHLLLETPSPEVFVQSMQDSGAPDSAEILAAQLALKKTGPGSSAAALYIQRAAYEARSTKHLEPRVRLTVHRHGPADRGQRQLEAKAWKRNEFLHDHDDANDLEFMLALQDACMERYAEQGLSIEANPSSNVYIGQLEEYSAHPIYRWHPPMACDLDEGGRFNRFGLRRRGMCVTINTDDPGMIPTTLRMEHHLMHEGAISGGCEIADADAWIGKLRQCAVDLFKSAH